MDGVGVCMRRQLLPMYSTGTAESGIGGTPEVTASLETDSLTVAARLRVVGLAGEVAFAGLDFPFLVRGPDLDAAETSVFDGIAGRVGNGVLAAQLALKLLESVVQRHLAINVENVAAGILRQLT